MAVKTKAVQERLGPAEVLPGTQEIKTRIAERMTGRLKTYIHPVTVASPNEREPN